LFSNFSEFHSFGLTFQSQIQVSSLYLHLAAPVVSIEGVGLGVRVGTGERVGLGVRVGTGEGVGWVSVLGWVRQLVFWQWLIYNATSLSYRKFASY